MAREAQLYSDRQLSSTILSIFLRKTRTIRATPEHFSSPLRTVRVGNFRPFSSCFTRKLTENGRRSNGPGSTIILGSATFVNFRSFSSHLSTKSAFPEGFFGFFSSKTRCFLQFRQFLRPLVPPVPLLASIPLPSFSTLPKWRSVAKPFLSLVGSCSIPLLFAALLFLYLLLFHSPSVRLSFCPTLPKWRSVRETSCSFIGFCSTPLLFHSA